MNNQGENDKVINFNNFSNIKETETVNIKLRNNL